MINIGLIGFGTVGKGVYHILEQNAALISERIGCSIVIKKIAVRSLDTYINQVPKSICLTNDVDELINDKEIDIIVEVIGGEFPAYDIISKALNHKKHVITANKEVISKHKKYFFKLAKKNGVDIYFEAAVGGGIPIIRSLKVGFAANKITAFYGILNGTTNYILTKLDEENLPYEEVLKNAQSLGFAEADPTMDVSGMDAAYKCTILAAVAFKIDVQVGDIYCEGIDKLSLGDFEYAKEFGFKIKLLAFGKRDSDDTFQLSVYPTMIPKDHPLAHVRNEYNAVYIVGDQVGDALLLGKGAGGAPTGSAIVSDIIDCAFGVSQPVSRRNLETHFIKGYVTPFEKTDSQFFLRLLVSNETGVLEKVTRQFSKHHVNIEKITQRETEAETAELVIVTQKISEKNCLSLVADLKKTAAINSVISKIRVLKL